MTKKIEKWRRGEDGLVAAIVWRAWMDWKAVSHIKPDEARELAFTTVGTTLSAETCRFAARRGYGCPADEIMAFFRSDWLLELMGLVGIEPLVGRIREIMEG